MHARIAEVGRARFFRTREIEEWTNAVFIHPLSELVARALDRIGVHPNVVSLGGMALGVAAGFAYHEVGNVWAALAGFFLMIGWHVLDGADGQLARLSGKTSEAGKVLDGVADHVAFTAVYVGLAAALAPVYGPGIWIVVLGAGLSHLAQSAAYEFQRSSYDCIVHAKSTACVPSPADFRRGLSRKRGLARVFGIIHLGYLHVQHLASAADGKAGAAVERSLRNASDPEAVRLLYRRANLDVVRAWSVLCSNYRTIALFAFSLAGLPLYYFYYEIAVLNVALLILTTVQRRRNATLQIWIADTMRGKAA